MNSTLLNLTNENGHFAINEQYFNPVGTVICFAGQVIPTGWIACDGSEISKTTYANLYSVIGNVYGNTSDPSNFRLPNLQQRLPIGKSNTYALGTSGGNASIVLTSEQLPQHSHTGTTDSSGTHSHTATDSGHAHNYEDAYFAENLSGGSNNVFGTSANTDNDNTYRFRPTQVTTSSQANISVAQDGAHTHTFTTNLTGNSASVNIMNPYLVLNYLIKY